MSVTRPVISMLRGLPFYHNTLGGLPAVHSSTTAYVTPDAEETL
jgi:hypothetical protein